MVKRSVLMRLDEIGFGVDLRCLLRALFRALSAASRHYQSDWRHYIIKFTF
jgi:hypothetical protein